MKETVPLIFQSVVYGPEMDGSMQILRVFKFPVPVSVLPLGNFQRGLEIKKHGRGEQCFFIRLESVVALGKNEL